jgi:hypothetical protein
MSRLSRVRVPPSARRFLGTRSAHALVLVGSLVMTVGSLMPWLRGSTRFVGNLNWTGLDDSGEGAMLIAAAIGLVLFVRLRRSLDELGPRSRFIPLGVSVVCALLWVVALRKVLQLSWFELEVGARPQPGLFVAGFGILLALAGSLLVAMDLDGEGELREGGDARKRGSGAGGGFGTASTHVRREGEIPPNRDDYSVVTRVDRPTSRDGDADDGGPARG